MLWGKKDEELPEELKGLTPEQIAEHVRAARSMGKAVPEALKGLTPEQIHEKLTKASDFETEVGTLTTERDTLKARIAELEGNQAPPPARSEEAPSMWADPDGYIDKRTEQTRLTALLSGMMSAKMYAMQQMMGEDAKIFKKYENEIDGIVKGYPDNMKILPQTWLNALVYTKGLHMTDINKARSEGTDMFAEVPGGGSGRPSNEPAPQEKLNEDELAMCKTMKWDPKKYLESRKQMTQVGEGRMGHGQYVTGK
jgi:hypothetical protein